MEAHMPSEMVKEDFTWRCLLKDEQKFSRSFQASKKNMIKVESQGPHSPRLTSIPTVNTLISGLHRSFSSLSTLVFSAPVSFISNPPPRRLIFNHSLPRLCVTDELKYSPTYCLSTWKALCSLSAYRSSTHHSPL